MDEISKESKMLQIPQVSEVKIGNINFIVHRSFAGQRSLSDVFCLIIYNSEQKNVKDKDYKNFY